MFCLTLCALLAASSGRGGGILQIKNGYFWDPQVEDYFIARGMAYQSFNPPVGADQTYEQVAYDFTEFKKMHANSVRCEFVWNQVETNHGVFDWSKPDFLVQTAEKTGLKLFVLIGFQYAPDWFPNDWKAVNNQGSNSVVLCYENPNARQAYSNYIAQVTRRYRNSSAIGAWILGNEYAYFDLWEPARWYLGYDAYSLASYRSYLADFYTNNIAALNANWGVTPGFTDWSQIAMPRNYPPDRNGSYWHDLLQWRKKSIGDYVALGAMAAKLSDPNHLRAYSMVGGLFGEADAHYTCEDTRTIVNRCAVAGAPLDFWAINNYAIASLDSELRSADFGIRKHQAAAGLPVLVSETGHTSTENLHAGASERQAAALPGQMWEALMSGTMGTHIFTWNDREMFAGGDFAREEGFGIVQQNRLSKGPVYSNVVAMFQRMEQLNLGNLLPGSDHPPADIQMFWSKSSDLGWPRANHENIRIWSTLKRLGYQPWIIFDEEFDSGAWTNAKALMLSRGFQIEPRHMNTIVSNVAGAGIPVHANADLPGQYNSYHKPSANWSNQMNYLFGLNVNGALPGWDGAVTNVAYMYQYVSFNTATPLGPLTNGYSDYVGTWKIWHGLRTNSGTTIVADRGLNDTQAPLPALHVSSAGPAKTAINTVALGDVTDWPPNQVMPHSWDIRYSWLRAIYRDYFQLPPLVDLAGSPGAQYIIPDYRICRNGSVLISLLNAHTNTATITLTAHALLDGKTVENLMDGGIVEVNSDGVLNLTLTGDQYVWLYAYPRAGGVDGSLVRTSPNKFWIASAPLAVWPNGTGYAVGFGYDLVDNCNLVVSFERVSYPGKVYSQAAPVSISGRGNQTVPVQIPDADLNDIYYQSTPEGGSYVFHAWLEKSGVRVSEISLPVRLLWGVRPISLPGTVVAGNTYQVPVRWEELPSYLASEGGMPLNRAALWQGYLAQSQYYDVVLELRTNGQAAATGHCLTSAGTGTNTFSITAPAGASGPFTWFAYLRPAPNATPSVCEGFENRGPGADAALLSPWIVDVYSQSNTATYLNGGVQPNGRTSQQSAFVVANNPTNSGAWAGFVMVYAFPSEWSLPSDLRQWTNYAMSFNFREAAALPCTLEIQLNDGAGGQLHFSKTYTPGSDGWDTIRATLDQFTVSTNAPFNGLFNLTRVSGMAMNVLMLRSNSIYVGAFDNIRLDAPLAAAPSGTSHDVMDSFEDRARGAQTSYYLPWSGAVYAEYNNASLLTGGVHPEASDGYQSAFLVVQNPPQPGSYAGFNLTYVFTNTWALPTNRASWSNYLFSYDFKEAEGNSCQFELQVKSSDADWMEFTKSYTPGPSGWDTIRASLNQFAQPSYTGNFDPNHVQKLVLNVRMLQTNVIYVASFDNARFSTPHAALSPEVAYGTYASTNDALLDADRDGIPDVYETGTGIYVSPANTGTKPNMADSDRDGMSDGAELVAGTDPNNAADVLKFTGVQKSGASDVLLSWYARTNRIYSIETVQAGFGVEPIWVPVGSLTNLSTPTNGFLHAIDSRTNAGWRLYRLTVR